jgi:hypothetical protein
MKRIGSMLGKQGRRASEKVLVANRQQARIEVYKLQDVAKALDLKSEGGSAFWRTYTREGVKSVISTELQERIENPIIFKLPNADLDAVTGATAHGYEAVTLIDFCDALIQARNDRKLAHSQAFLALQAEIIIRSSAKLGINVLVDGATGYIHDRIHEEYRRLFAKFISEECRQYENIFPDKFFDAMYRVYDIRKRNDETFKGPGFFAHLIRKYVYHPLANSNGAIHEMLEEKNPVVYVGGGRKYKLYQFLDEKIGEPALRAHIWQIVGIAAVSTDKKQFERNFYRAFPEARPKGLHEQLDLLDRLADRADRESDSEKEQAPPHRALISKATNLRPPPPTRHPMSSNQNDFDLAINAD